MIGASIQIIDNNTLELLFDESWQGYDMTVEIESGITYTVTVGNIVGYMNPSSQVYQALPTFIRNINITYNNSSGIYIEAIDGTLYASSNWDNNSGKILNSVVVLSSNKNFRIPSSHRLYLIAAGDDAAWETTAYYNSCGSILKNSLALAKADYNGYENTLIIKSFVKTKGVYDNSHLYGIIDSLRFPNNEADIYVPSCGEQNIMVNNQTEINNCFTILNCDTISLYQTSTVAPTNGYWPMVWTARSTDAIAFSAGYGWYAGTVGSDVIGPYS